MAKAKSKNKESLQIAKNRTRGTIRYRQMKDSRVIVTKWPTKRKRSKIK